MTGLATIGRYAGLRGSHPAAGLRRQQEALGAAARVVAWRSTWLAPGRHLAIGWAPLAGSRDIGAGRAKATSRAAVQRHRRSPRAPEHPTLRRLRAASGAVARVAAALGRRLCNRAPRPDRLQRKQIGFVDPPRDFILAGMDHPVMTTIGDALWQFVSKQTKQAALAEQWLEQWRQRNDDGPDWQSVSIESHFSRLKNSDPRGVRFFFENPARADLLFEILGVPEDHRDRIRALARSALHTAPRLVVDISEWSGTNETLAILFDELEKRILRDCPLQPIAMILTEQQWAKSPQSYSALRTLHLHKVGSPADGQAAAVELAGADTLVVAPWQFDPSDRWLAAEFSNNILSFEPGNGLAVFAEHGAMPAEPAVEHPLDQICEPDAVRFRGVDEFTPARRRWWMYTLADEERTIEALKTSDGLRTPARRLAFARQVGVAATSTARERLDHELDQLAARLRAALNLSVDVLDPVAHAERLARAELRPTPPAAWRCGDELHVLHAASPIDHPRIVVHRPAPAVPALTRLLEHMSEWTVYDHEADPTLARAVEALAPEGNERPALVHARAAVLWNGLRPEPRSGPRCEGWADELRAILAQDPPPASLRLRLPDSENEREYLAFDDDNRLTASMKSPSALLVRPPGRRTIIADRERTVLRVDGGPPETATLMIDSSSSESVEVRLSRGYTARIFADPERRGYGGGSNVTALWLPVLSRPKPDVDLWLDCMERSSSLGGWDWEHSKRCENLLRSTGSSRIKLLEAGSVKAEKLSIDPATWREADLHLAHCWLALRAALELPRAVRVATGVVCSLGGGVSALLEIHTRRRSAPPTVVAAFDATVDNRTVKLDLCFISTHAAQVGSHMTEFGIRLPSHLVLQTPTISASITFIASPLLHAGLASASGAIAPVVVAHIVDGETSHEVQDDD